MAAQRVRLYELLFDSKTFKFTFSENYVLPCFGNAKRMCLHSFFPLDM